jgi:hypothetical protein
MSLWRPDRCKDYLGHIYIFFFQPWTSCLKFFFIYLYVFLILSIVYVAYILQNYKPEMKAFTDFLELGSSDLLLAVVCLVLNLHTRNSPLYLLITNTSLFLIIICTNIDGWTKMYCCTIIPMGRATQYIVEKRWIMLLWIAKMEHCCVVQKFISYILAVEVITLLKTMELDFAKISVHEFSMTQATRSRKKHFWNLKFTCGGKLYSCYKYLSKHKSININTYLLHGAESFLRSSLVCS